MKNKKTINSHVLGHQLLRQALYLCHAFASVVRLRMPVFRERYIMTSTGRFRLRYLAMVCVFLLGFSGVGLAALWSGEKPSTSLSYMPPIPVVDMAPDQTTVPSVTAREQADTLLNAMEATPPAPMQWTEQVTFQSGDTFGRLLNDLDIGMADVNALIKALSPYIKPQDFKVGQSLDLQFDRSSGAHVLQSLSLKLSDIKTLSVIRANDSFVADVDEVELVEEKRMAKTTIATSIYADLRKAGVPKGVINDMIRSYAWSVDFQRDIWGGEEIELLYTVKASDDGSIIKAGELHFANLAIRGKERPIYRHQHKDGRVAYYAPDGRSVKKALLRTPVDGARVSSGYGMRRHPILGYNKMHKGVDFAAPRGTPIYAAGDGVIEKIYHSKSYGKYIRIRHNGTYKTAYAHMHRFAKGMKNGSRVKQGQVIGYVGSTGRSTGPHLHYEVHKNGKQVNPRSVNLPIGDKLSGTELANFKNTVLNYQKQFARLDPDADKKMAASPAQKPDLKTN